MKLRPIACWLPLLLVPFAVPLTSQGHPGLHPAEISGDQATQTPYRYSGRVLVNFGKDEYLGTASSLRRYTGLTAGHILYDPKGGFGTNLRYQIAYYYGTGTTVTVSSFAVLSGYQAAADDDPDSDPAFDQDMGYLLFSQPMASDSLAPWSTEPDALIGGTNFLVLGYAADKLSGEALAFVQTAAPFYLEDDPALYENTAYYTEGGMSGGPVYVTYNGTVRVAAITVAGTDYKDPAYSDVRVITSNEVPLFVDAEYTHGLITGGIISGKAKIRAGKTKPFTAGVTFADGQSETVGLPAIYDEVTLVATGANKHAATVTKIKDGSYTVGIAPGTPSGTQVNLKLFRDDSKRKEQTALAVQTITVK